MNTLDIDVDEAVLANFSRKLQTAQRGVDLVKKHKKAEAATPQI